MVRLDSQLVSELDLEKVNRGFDNLNEHFQDKGKKGQNRPAVKDNPPNPKQQERSYQNQPWVGSGYRQQQGQEKQGQERPPVKTPAPKKEIPPKRAQSDYISKEERDKLTPEEQEAKRAARAKAKAKAK